MPPSGIMTDCVSREQVLAVLQSMQGAMCYVLRPALEAWLHAVEHMPQHPRSAQGNVAVQAVQNALQQAPLTVQPVEGLDWALSNLTDVNELVICHMKQQLDVSIKRLGILQRLQEQGSTQLSDKWATEAAAYHWLGVIKLVLRSVNPAAAVVELLLSDMADPTAAAMDALASRSGKSGKTTRSLQDYNGPVITSWRHLVSHSRQQGTELLNRLENRVGGFMKMHTETQVQMDQIRKELRAVNPKLLDSWMHDEVLCRQTQLAKQLHLTGAMVWLRAISDLPSGIKHGAVDAMLRSIDWELLRYVQQQDGVMHSFWVKLLARPNLIDALLRVWDDKVWGCFMKGYGITAKDLKTSGLSKQTQQLLLRYKKDVKVWGQGIINEGATNNSEKAHEPVQDNKPTPVEAPAVEPAAEPEPEPEQDEMQALVQMMYGQSVPKEEMQAI